MRSKSLLSLVISLFLFFYFTNQVMACIPSPGTNIYLNNKISINLEMAKNLGVEGKNYILDNETLTYRNIFYPNEIAVKVNKIMITISPFSENLTESLAIADDIDWPDLVGKELNFLKNNQILQISDENIGWVSNCSSPSSIIKSEISEKNIVTKECNNWYRVSDCIKGEICLPCINSFVGSVPIENPVLEEETGEDISEVKFPIKVILSGIIVLIVSLLVLWRFKK